MSHLEERKQVTGLAKNRGCSQGAGRYERERGPTRMSRLWVSPTSEEVKNEIYLGEGELMLQP